MVAVILQETLNILTVRIDLDAQCRVLNILVNLGKIMSNSVFGSTPQELGKSQYRNEERQFLQGMQPSRRH